ncbi:MAG: adenosine deaminase [Alteromonadaceae bacterium]|nr:adenosine deaminase [Alteromonadaceae bacterium]
MFSKEQPLIDLHRHLDGNIRPETTWKLAQQHGIALPVNDFAQFIPLVQIQKSEPDLMSFLKKLDWGVSVLKTLDDCKRIAFENVEDAHNAGLDYAELRFSPYYMSMAHNLPVADVVAAVIDGIDAGVKQYTVKINLIGILSRTFGVEKCQQELTGLLAHKNKLVAIDLAGDEYNYPGELFVEHFNQVTDAGLHITIHAGEAGDSSSVWQAIKGLRAERIGHGVASAQDPELMAYMAANNISIESCLTSNYQTGTVKNIAEHPIKTFMAHGVNVFLNTDDPAVEGIELKHEFELAKSLLKFSDSEIVQLQKNALNACFLSDAEKKSLQKTKCAK